MASASGKPSYGRSLIQTAKHTSNSSALLKDYLRDDLSSCSSSGFKSFPRRQCCSTVGLKDLKRRQCKKKNVNKNLSRRETSSVSALQRASDAIINAVKSLPLSRKSAKAKRAATGHLSRSLSRKLLSRSFWRKAAKDEVSEGVPRWRRLSFRELLMQDKEQCKTTSFKEEYTAIYTVPSIISISSGCGSNSWGESEFTFSSSATSSDGSTENDPVDGNKEVLPRHKIVERVSATDWSNEKEQFSPVSVLDCPFEDEKSDSNSTTHSFLEGAKHKHKQKRRHFESVTSIEPLDLETRITSRSELEDEPNHNSTKQCSSALPIMPSQNGNNSVHRDNIEDNVRDLVNVVKKSIPSNNCSIIEAENLLFDYFKQSIEETKDIDHSKKLHLCKVAEDWINGQPQELYLGWEVQRRRGVYITEMDKRGEWKNSDQETQELSLELENEVFTGLVNELVLELTCNVW